MKRIYIALFMLLALGASQQTLAGGGWTSPKGGGFLKVGQRAITGNQFFDLNGNVIPITTTGVHITSIYGEYGLTDKLELNGYIPLLIRSTLNEVQYTRSGRIEPGDQFNGFGDPQLGLKYSLVRAGNLAVSGSLHFGLPLGNPSGGETGLLQSGDGEFNQLVMLEAGYSFGKFPGYAGLGVGFNNRTKGFSEEFRLNAEVGYQPHKSLWVIARFYMVRSFFNGMPEVAVNGIFSNNTQYLSPGLEVAYSPGGGKWGISVGAAGAMGGSNIIAAPSLDGGVFFKW